MSNNNYVFGSYFVSTPDPQRNKTWTADINAICPLISSVTKFGHKVIIFHDCFEDAHNTESCEWVYVKDDITHKYTSSVVRWFRYHDYLLSKHQSINALFMVDSTDVEMLSDPFSVIKSDMLYAGDEYSKISSWLSGRNSKFNPPDYNDIVDANKTELLLNAGVVGGNSSICMEFLSLLTSYHTTYNTAGVQRSFDMPGFNYTIWKHFKDRLIHGDPVNTKFKKYEYDYTKWWKHK